MQSLAASARLLRAIRPVISNIHTRSWWNRRRAQFDWRCESLESRQYLSTIYGTTGDDQITLNYSTTNPTVTINGSSQSVNLVDLSIDGLAGNDTFIVNGHGARIGWYKPTSNQSHAGNFIIRKSTSSPVHFTNIESVQAIDFWKFALVTPGSADAEAVNPVTGGIRITGSSGGVTFAPLTVSSITRLVLDTATNDAGGSGNDSITLGTSGTTADLSATTLLVNSGVGSNTLNVLGQTSAIINTSFGSQLGTLLSVTVGEDSTQTPPPTGANVQFLSTQVLDSLYIKGSSQIVLPANK